MDKLGDLCDKLHSLARKLTDDEDKKLCREVADVIWEVRKERKRWNGCSREMRKLYDEHEPESLQVGQWHLPYIEIWDPEHDLFVEEFQATPEQNAKLCKISTARCARVSYLTHDGRRDFNEDIALHDKLSTNGHWSPFEHPAQCLETSERSGNFIGWRQYRKTFENEHYGKRLP